MYILNQVSVLLLCASASSTGAPTVDQTPPPTIPLVPVSDLNTPSPTLAPVIALPMDWERVSEMFAFGLVMIFVASIAILCACSFQQKNKQAAKKDDLARISTAHAKARLSYLAATHAKERPINVEKTEDQEAFDVEADPWAAPTLPNAAPKAKAPKGPVLTETQLLQLQQVKSADLEAVTSTSPVTRTYSPMRKPVYALQALSSVPSVVVLVDGGAKSALPSPSLTNRAVHGGDSAVRPAMTSDISLSPDTDGLGVPSTMAGGRHSFGSRNPQRKRFSGAYDSYKL